MGLVSGLRKLTATELALIPSRRKRGYVETSVLDMMKPVMVSVQLKISNYYFYLKWVGPRLYRSIAVS